MGGCNGSSPQPEAPKTADTVPVGEPVVEAPKPVNRPPVIHITDTVDTKRMVLCVRDSAAVYERIAPKLGEIYLVRIGALIGKSGVRITGKPMAWFTRKDGAFFFEAGFPVDKKPAKLPPQFLIRETKSDSITMAHFYGPYPLVSEGYTALEEYLLNNGRSAKGQPYELYVDDPVDSTGKPKDPWKVRTDIVFPWK
jgi:effector-binding domain-containing protein